MRVCPLTARQYPDVEVRPSGSTSVQDSGQEKWRPLQYVSRDLADRWRCLDNFVRKSLCWRDFGVYAGARTRFYIVKSWQMKRLKSQQRKSELQRGFELKTSETPVRRSYLWAIGDPRISFRVNNFLFSSDQSQSTGNMCLMCMKGTGSRNV